MLKIFKNYAKVILTKDFEKVDHALTELKFGVTKLFLYMKFMELQTHFVQHFLYSSKF